MSQQARELITRLKQARAIAMPGPWIPGQEQPEWKNYPSGNLEFCCLAANSTEAMCEMLTVAIDDLESRWQRTYDVDAHNTLCKISAIAQGGGE